MDDQNKSVNERWAPPTDRGERGYATDPGFGSGDYASRPDYGTTPGTPETDDMPERRTTEIREEIDRTRADLSETIEAIQDRLRPGNVASRAAESVRDATVGRVTEFANSMTGRGTSRDRDRDDDWRYRSLGWDGSPRNGLMDRIRDNPMAAAMAAGSIAWLFLGSRRQPRGYEYSRQDRERGLYGSTRGPQPYVREVRLDIDEDSSSFDDRRNSDWGNTGQGWSRNEDGGWRRGAGETGGDMMGQASDMGRRARNAASDMRRRGGRFASDSPFAAGAIAAAIGLAIGLAIPETERENEIMGEARDSMIDAGKDAVRTAAERVQTAAGEVQRVAGDALKGVTSSGGAQQGGSNASTGDRSSTTQAQGSQGSQSQPPQAQGSQTAATETAVPGMPAGSGGTGSIPTTRTNRGTTPKTR